MEQAHAAFVEEDWDRAVKLYTEHLATLEASGNEEEKAVALASRAAACLKLRRDAEAFEDASQACALNGDYEVAFYRKGLAAFALGKYSEAQGALEKGLALRGGEDAPSRKYGAWLRKCQLELEEEQGSSSSSSKAVAPPATPVVPVLSPPTGPAKYQYYQSGTHVTVTLLQKGVKEEESEVAIEPRRLKVALKADAGGVVLFDKPLFDAVDPAESQAKFFGTKVEIKLKKASPYQWADLVGSASATSSAPAPLPSAAATAAAAAVPAVANNGGASKARRPYASHKDWEAVEREITKELEKEKPEGEDALNKLFQDIYKNASDDTRRAMVKSFQTSGGTVLSTNWEEVAKKDYEKEKQAPEGMEWRKWG